MIPVLPGATVLLIVIISLAVALGADKKIVKPSIAITLGTAAILLVMLFSSQLRENSLTILGIELSSAGISFAFIFNITVVAVAALIFSHRYLEHYTEKNIKIPYYFTILLFIFLMQMIPLVRNWVVFLLLWELMTIASYFLILYDHKDMKAIKAGTKYFILMHIFSAVPLLAACAFIMASTGTFAFSAFEQFATPIVLFAVLGFGVKASFFPLYFWLPEAHPVAPSPVSALLSGAMVKLGLYGIFVMLSFANWQVAEWLMIIFGIVAFGSIAIAVFSYSAQKDLKTLFAWSTIDNIGWMFIILITGIYGVGNVGIILEDYVINHGLAKGAAFLVAGMVIYTFNTRKFEELVGVVRKYALVGWIIILAMFALEGVPPFGLFISKMNVLISLYQVSPVLGIMLAVSWILAFLAFLTFIHKFFLSAGELEIKRKVPLSMAFPVLALLMGAILVGPLWQANINWLLFATANMPVMLFGSIILLFIAGAVSGLPFTTKQLNSLKTTSFFAGIAFLLLVVFAVTTAPAIIGGQALNFTIFNLPFHIDALALVLCLVLGILGFAVSLYTPSYMSRYAKQGKGWLFGMFYNLFALSMLVTVTTSNLMVLLFSWEAMTFISFLFVIWKMNKESEKAGFKYFAIMHIASSLPLIIAVVIISVTYGTLNMNVLGDIMQGTPLLYILFLLGFGSKAGVFPFYFWLPATYPVVPSNAVALFSGVMAKVAVYGLIRTTCFMLPYSLTFGNVVAALGAITLVAGTLFALKQKDTKRLLAFHSVGQMGYIWLGIGIGMIFLARGGEHTIFGVLAMAAGLYHLFNHTMFKGLLFLSAGSIMRQTNSQNLNLLGGLLRTMPVTGIALFIGVLSISGIPPFSGFMSKWLLYQVTFLSGEALLILFGIMAFFISAATLASMLKLYATSFTGEPNELTKNTTEVPKSMLIGKGILSFMCIISGLFPFLFLPLFASVGKTLAGITDISPYITFDFWLVGIKAPLMDLAARAYFSPVALTMILMAIVVVVLLISRKPKKVVVPWGGGYVIPAQDHKLKAKHYYLDFEGSLEGVYHFDAAYSKNTDKWIAVETIAKTAAAGDMINKIENAVGEVFLRLSALKNIAVRAGYIDEAVYMPIVRFINNMSSFAKRTEVSLSGNLVLTAIILAGLIILLLVQI